MIVILLNPCFLRGYNKNIQLCGTPPNSNTSIKNVSKCSIKDKLNIKGVAFYPICLHLETGETTCVYMNKEQFDYFEKRITNIKNDNYIFVNIPLSENEFNIIQEYYSQK